MNEIRARRGLHTVRSHPQLEHSAWRKWRRIRVCGFTHYPCGDSWMRPFFQAGYLPVAGAWYVGENLFRGSRSPWEAFHSFMHSRDHRRIVLKGSFRHFGSKAGHAKWVLHFGHR